MKTFRVFAECTNYYSIEVKARNAEEAYRIAYESDGGEWTDNGCGKWIIEEDLIHEYEPMEAKEAV